MRLPRLRYKSELGQKTAFGIGIVGAGAIVEVAHLPAYQNSGFEVVGIFDPAVDRASSLADRFSLGKVFLTLDEMLADPQVEIIDIAIPPLAQPLHCHSCS